MRANIDILSVVRVRIIIVRWKYDVARGATVNVEQLHLLKQLSDFRMIVPFRQIFIYCAYRVRAHVSGQVRHTRFSRFHVQHLADKCGRKRERDILVRVKNRARNTNHYVNCVRWCVDIIISIISIISIIAILAVAIGGV